MKRTPTSLARRTVMWAAGVALALSVAAWLASLFNFAWCGPHRTVAIASGVVVAGDEMTSTEPMWLSEGFRWQDMSQWPHWEDRAPYWEVCVPLGLPALIAGAVTAPPWMRCWRQRRRRVRALAGLCCTCGYDLTGVTGPCPECGREKQEREA